MSTKDSKRKSIHGEPWTKNKCALPSIQLAANIMNNEKDPAKPK